MTFGATAEETRIAITFCGAKNLAVIDGNGKIQWELPGYHLESIDVGRIMPDTEGLQLLVDYDHEPDGKSPIWVIDGSSGKALGQLITNSSRHHKLIDWDGDGLDEFVVARDHGLYDHTGQRTATLGTESQDGDHVHIGDMTGDGHSDILLTAKGKIYIYKNELGAKEDNSIPGLGLNV
ncbi:MAG: VCBS repeat-containing protein, partial [Planctomycetes bacterium]|nr:VCBS repeat-containing protein [Planctomycetota bacterium]